MALNRMLSTSRPSRARTVEASRPLSSPDMSRRPVITYRGRHGFPVPPPKLWEIIQEVDQFESWWPWLEDFRLHGTSLCTGAVLSGVVAPPLPYRMHIEIELTRWEPECNIEALIHGDLEGWSTIELHDRGASTEVVVAWTVEMMQAAMRLADRFTHPVLQWGHDRVVELTIAGFRKRLQSAR
jgi:uncharacterized protein YndB with AHSA1/START domain